MLLDGLLLPPGDARAQVLQGGQTLTIRASAGDPFSALIPILFSAGGSALAATLGYGAFVSGLISGVALLVGGLIANAFAPDPEPPESLERARPLFSLSGGSNVARPYSPLPLVLGSHRIYPDLAAQGYNSFKDHDDYLHQVFGVGLGALDISYIRIGETPADDIPGITTQVLKGVASADGEQAWDVRSHEGAVLTDEPWQEAAQSDTGAKAKWHQWRTAEGSTHVEIDLVVDAYDVTDKGKQVASRVNLRTGYQLGANTLRVYSRSPYRPSRITQRYALRSAGAQDIGLRLLFILRLNTGSIIEDIAKKLRDRETIDVVVRAVRSLRPDEGDYAGQSRLRVAARASERLSGSLERVSMMVANRVSVYDRESRKWAAAASSNPAWLFRTIVRGIRVRGRLRACLCTHR